MRHNTLTMTMPQLDRTTAGLQASYQTLEAYGNLSGASLPYILKRTLEIGQFAGDRYGVMLGFGAGFSASAALVQLKGHAE
jgi:3-oxoacyl-[acyl-carrier-protein] synthase III